MIPYGRQTIDESDIRAVVRVLKSDRLTQGVEVEKFEEAFAKYCGVPYAVAVSSGTAGLHLASLVAGFSRGDEIISSPLTFVATTNSLLYCGATPIFADIDQRSLGLSRGNVQRKITGRTKGILNVHFAGQPSRLGRRKIFLHAKIFCDRRRLPRAGSGKTRQWKAKKNWQLF